MPTIYLLDVTNRDGVQASRIGLAKLQKTILNLHLDKFGVFQSEAGFPNLKHEANYLNANVELAQKGVISRMRVSGWTRAIPVDIEDSWRMTQVRHFNISISTSDQMIIHKFQGKLDRESVVKEMVETLELAKQKGAESVGANSEDASRTDMKYLLRFASEAKAHGATRFRYCDTLGYEYPDHMYARAKTLAKEVGIPIEAHCHNDLGMVVANSVACALGALDGGVDAYINTTVNAVGERAGNCDLVSVVLALRYASSLSERNLLDPNVNLRHAWKIAKYASYAFGIPIPINQPGVGANMFAHESGIHADGALKDRRNYELYDFEELGRGEPEVIATGRVITTGEYGGIKGFRQAYSDLGMEFDNDKQARETLELAQYANLHTCKPLHEDELRFIYEYPEQARKILTITP